MHRWFITKAPEDRQSKQVQVLHFTLASTAQKCCDSRVARWDEKLPAGEGVRWARVSQFKKNAYYIIIMRIVPNTWQPQARSKKIPSTHTPRIKEMTAFKTRI